MSARSSPQEITLQEATALLGYAADEQHLARRLLTKKGLMPFHDDGGRVTYDRSKFDYVQRKLPSRTPTPTRREETTMPKAKDQNPSAPKLDFRDPSAEALGRTRKKAPELEALRALIEHPQRWAVVRTYDGEDGEGRAMRRACHLRSNRFPKPPAPGTFDFAADGPEIFARYVPDPN